MALKLIKTDLKKIKRAPKKSATLQEGEDHLQILDTYIKSHVVRNYAECTLKREKDFLHSWFKFYGHPNRPLFVWEAMEPVIGRKRILDYASLLIKSELSPAIS